MSALRLVPRSAVPASLRVLTAAELGARSSAAALVAAARREAAALVDAARSEREAVLAAARSEGLAQAQTAAAALLARAASRAEERAAVDRERLYDLAVELARAVLDHEAAAGPAVLTASIERAMSALRRARGVVLRVHPEDLAAAQAWARDDAPAGLAFVECEADAAIARGGVCVETELGRFDARLDAQLAALREALREP